MYAYIHENRARADLTTDRCGGCVGLKQISILPLTPYSGAA